MEYPKMFYRPGSEIEWEGVSLDTLIVENADEEAAAVKAGWSKDGKQKRAKNERA